MGSKEGQTISQFRFAKMQGVGNDFVVIDGRKNGDFDWSGLAIEICDRHSGVGADGLLVLDDTRLADVMMRMYNPDGTPDVCGNGLRCVARYAVERGLVAGDTLRVGTLAGVRPAQVHRDGCGRIVAVTVGMGLPRFDPPSIPMRAPGPRVIDYPLKVNVNTILPITVLSTGSTHAITFVEELPEDARFFSLSPQVEHHPLFPDRTSLMWCQVEGPSRLRMRIWERGAGETWGCGTGACAAAVAAILHGYAAEGEPVAVSSRGGELVIRWREGEPIEMTGPAEFVFDGIYRLDPSRPIGTQLLHDSY
ncbi:MAG TPA: diaminopimelate epimerase [Chthonomonadaceae bacterium]|nr:diaminopimelate epimerase [Chthonomonadaceae bacterium]